MFYGRTFTDFGTPNPGIDFTLLPHHYFKMFLPEVFLSTSIFILCIHASLIATSRRLSYPLVMQSFGKLSVLILFLACVVLVVFRLLE